MKRGTIRIDITSPRPAAVLDHHQRQGKAEQEFDDDIGGREHRRQRERPTGDRISQHLSEILQTAKAWPGIWKS
jgi:hypothetical protein